MRVRVPAAGDAAGTPRRTRLPLALLVPLLVGLLGIASPLPAQTAPKVIYACYVPLTGTVYRIKEPDIKQECSSTSHVPFSWVDGLNAVRAGDAAGGDLSGSYPSPSVAGLHGRPVASAAPSAGQVLTFDGSKWAPTTPSAGGGTSDHGTLTGLTDDDHPQYLLGNGARSYDNGFAVTGTVGMGSLPYSGTGSRFLWYPAKAALRAGEVSSVWISHHNDAADFGSSSVALGRNTTATGSGAIALGRQARVTADGTFFFNSDASGDNTVFLAGNEREFRVRATGGVHFTTGGGSCRMEPGSAVWACTSDATLKTDFEGVDAEEVLSRVAALPIERWRYLEEDRAVRHLGPTAQDFRAAFGLGAGDRSIAMVDADGVSLLSIQALEKRTAEQAEAIDRLQARETEIDSLRAENQDLKRRLGRLEVLLQSMRQR